MTGSIRDRSEAARTVLTFAAMLADAPIGGVSLVDGVAGVLGAEAPTLVAEALDELDKHGLIRRVPDTRPQSWQVPPQVAKAVRREADQVLMAALAERAARILTKELAGASLDACAHAVEVARNPTVALDNRLALLRAASALHEDNGNMVASWNIRDLAVQTAGKNGPIQDVQAAARLAVTAGGADVALRQAKSLIERALAERDVHAEFEARLIAATAHDVLGEYPAADRVFHQHALIREHGPIPLWLSEVDCHRAGLARVRALRLRGQYRAARQVAGTLDRTQSGGAVELARLHLVDGEFIEARTTARAVAWTARNQLAREAAVVLAEAEVALAFPEMRARPEGWLLATEQLRRALADSAAGHGIDDLLTLELMLLRGQALSNSGEHGGALAVLSQAERRIAAVLGADHPFHLRARQWTGLVLMGRHDWAAAAGIFEWLLPRQVAVLGRCHPESELTRFQLGMCLLRRNNVRSAKPLLDEAALVLREQHGPLRQWTSVAESGRLLTRVPGPLRRWVNLLDKARG